MSSSVHADISPLAEILNFLSEKEWPIILISLVEHLDFHLFFGVISKSTTAIDEAEAEDHSNSHTLKSRAVRPINTN